jgi:hypothetical protein
LPLLALPMWISAGAAGASSLAGRWGAWACASVPLLLPLYVLRGDSLRELAFHGLVPAHPVAWALGWFALGGASIALVPAIPGRFRRRAGAVLLIVALGLAAAAWSTGEYDPPFVRHEPLGP